MNQVFVRVDHEMRRYIDRIAKRLGVTRSGAIRYIITQEMMRSLPPPPRRRKTRV
jgi:antitoxin component of RelBE/YafQ-DinJ toxin-antitoxin module